MTDIAISVKHLTKVYKLYNKPSDRLKEALHPLRKKYHKEHYSLHDVSFDIKKGETVGIIGKNGAGKSTLLKVITGVLTPTSGSVHVHGKIASLLELGAGFNPDYTGLENIYFQGSLMGYTREEMESKVVDILTFADIGEFIHQPVKTYSSGMFARLAFSVAINVEPDILIVDEALSVGDAAFQNKCIRKMEAIGKKGITVLFVSHDTQTVNKFCNSVIWLHGGVIKEQGIPEIILENYMSFISYGLETDRNIKNTKKEESSFSLSSKFELKDVTSCDSFGKKDAVIESIGFFDQDNSPITNLKQGTTVKFVCEFSTSVDLHDLGVGVLLKDTLNNEILTFNSYMYKSSLGYLERNKRIRTTVEFKVPKLYPREYLVTVALSEGTQLNHVQQHWIHSATTINILSCDFIDGCVVSLYPHEVEYKYEQI